MSQKESQRVTFEEWAKSVFKHGTDAEYGIARAAWDAATTGLERENAELRAKLEELEK